MGLMFNPRNVSQKSSFYLFPPRYNKLKKHCSKPCPRNESDEHQLQNLFSSNTSQNKIYDWKSVVLTGNSTYVAQYIIGQTRTFSLILLSDCELTVHNGKAMGRQRMRKKQFIILNVSQLYFQVYGCFLITHFLNIHRFKNTIIQYFYIQLLAYSFHQKEW